MMLMDKREALFTEDDKEDNGNNENCSGDIAADQIKDRKSAGSNNVSK